MEMKKKAHRTNILKDELMRLGDQVDEVRKNVNKN